MSSRRSAKLPLTRLAAALILALQAGAVLAGPAVQFDIPAQPLASALRSLASQAGIQLVFTPEQVGTGQSPALQGEMSVDAAFTRLLAQSPLEFRQDGERSYLLVERSGPGRTLALPETTVTATRTERRVEDVPASVTVMGVRVGSTWGQ